MVTAFRQHLARRIGILGGSFNPPHLGHLRSAMEVMEGLGLDGMQLIPSGAHPFKGREMQATPEERLDMVRLAVSREPRFEANDIEVLQDGVGYTIDTLRSLARSRPTIEWVLVLGSDLLNELHLWKTWQLLIKYAHLCIMTRPGYIVDLQQTEAGRFLEPFMVQSPELLYREEMGRNGVIIQPVTPMGISSTAMREALVAGRSIDYLTPTRVVNYIQKQELYRP
ncbi:nicotinate-nucleotide adenylyltransferase [Magnetococcus marinus MC-1]|uniref:Probable nicotinate-nucleotide adenylyltransferase n=1 Tax=Magnetococcus marinus (strain ATCC BAA-1437 / JCM 17883 / MC-1) TaxID=156889 RepID=A0LCZ0_MAGMM|nr:nicotinate-nucleotide adenylyltransferase [Magnetococcus marinus]ABK45833.1 nicotinate-nucleotide adenylyltransferase [Magnetococcus marinus MC-1]